MDNEILHEILGEVKGIKSDVSELRNDVSALKVGQQKLEAGQRKLEADIINVQSDITTMKTDITSMQTDTVLIPFVKQAVSEVGAELLENSETTNQIQKIVKEHKVTLEILSARSIEHEAKLKQIV